MGIALLRYKAVLFVGVPCVSIGSFCLGVVGVIVGELGVFAINRGIAIEAPWSVVVQRKIRTSSSRTSTLCCLEEVEVALCIEVDGLIDDATVLHGLLRTFHIIYIGMHEVHVQLAQFNYALGFSDDGSQFVHAGLTHLTGGCAGSLSSHQLFVLCNLGL